MRKFYILLCCFSLATISLFSQSTINQQWLYTYINADSIQDVSIEIDAHHCVFVLGTSDKEGKQADIVLLRFSKDGTLLWSADYDNPSQGSDYAIDLIVDDNCNSYILSHSDSSSQYYSILLKFDSSGTKLWETAYHFQGSYATLGTKMVMDINENLIVTGNFQDPVTYIHTAFAAKYNKQGNLIWESSFDPNGLGSSARTLTTDFLGNIYLAGWFLNDQSNYDYNIMIIKIDSNSNQQWIQSYSGTGDYQEEGSAVSLDTFGNIYIGGFIANMGTNADWVLLKYSSSGNLIWAKTINGSINDYDYLSDILVHNNFIYASGSLSNDYQYNSGALFCYDLNGNLLWKKERDFYYGGKLATGKNGEIYQLNGYRFSTPDYNITAYDNLGNILWEQIYNGPMNSKDQPTSLSVDGDNNVYVTGYSVAAMSGTSSIVGIVTIKYGPQLPCNLTANAGPDTTICPGQSNTLNAIATGGTTPYTYQWNTGETEQSITVVTEGIFSVTIADNNGCQHFDSVIVNSQPPQSNISITASGTNTFCQGDQAILTADSGYSYYLWSNGGNNQSILADVSGIYGITATKANGCQDTSSFNLSLSITPPLASPFIHEQWTAEFGGQPLKFKTFTETDDYGNVYVGGYYKTARNIV